MAQVKKIVVVGASSAIAEHCARLWVASEHFPPPEEMILIGRNQLKLNAIAADLQVRAPRMSVRTRTAHFLDAAAIYSLADECTQSGPADIVLIAHGILAEQELCQKELQSCRTALDINGISPVLFAEAFAGQMEQAGRGVLIILSSVAGDRGRKSNYVYGAAKGMVSRYAQGLQHRFASTGIRVVLVKPGPTATPMTAHLQAQGMRMASVEHVAQYIVRGVERGRQTIYAPAKWAFIMLIIRHIPSALFKKLNI